MPAELESPVMGEAAVRYGSWSRSFPLADTCGGVARRSGTAIRGKLLTHRADRAECHQTFLGLVVLKIGVLLDHKVPKQCMLGKDFAPHESNY